MNNVPEKRRAIVRVTLGNAQMLAAVVAIVLLWRFGVGLASIVSVAVAGALLVTSLILFRVVWRG